MESEIILSVKCLVIFLCESVGLARRPNAVNMGIVWVRPITSSLTHFASKTICSERVDAVLRLKVLSDSNSFLNQMVEILGEVRGKAFGLEDSQDFISSHKTDLGHPV